MKLPPYILDTFNIKQEESQKFVLLFFHSFFLGLFIAFYFTPANSEFIRHFDSEQLPMAYIVAGIAGYLTSTFYSVIQKKINSRSLFLGALLFMFVTAIAGRVGLHFFESKWLSFFVFIWAWPFISLVGIESGGLALRLLNLRQVKRLYGLINMGGIIASILGYLVQPLFLKFLSHSYDLLYIGVSGIVVSIVILLYMYKIFPERSPQEETEEEAQQSKSRFSDLFKNKYYILIFASATLSMTMIYISDFGFLASIKAQKSIFHSPEVVSSFMALVFGGLKIGELIMSYFSSRLLSKYGVRLGLTILPVTSTGLIFLACVTGWFAGAYNVMFLVLMVLNKSLERILRRSLDDPSFNVLYQTLPEKMKLSFQAKVGVVMQISIGIAGALLLAANKILITDQGFKLELFPWFFLPLLIAWLIVASNLYSAYKEKIREILILISRKKTHDTIRYIYGSEVLIKKFTQKNVDVLKMTTTILTETNPRKLELYARRLLNINHTTIRRGILRIVDPTWNYELINLFSNIYNDPKVEKSVRNMAHKAMNFLDFSVSHSMQPGEVKFLLKNKTYENKLNAIKYLFGNRGRDDEERISELIDDEDHTIRRAAIYLAIQRNTPKLVSKLITLLNDPAYYHQVGSLLLLSGERIVPELEKFFANKAPEPVLLKIIELYAKINTIKTNGLLVKHLYFPSREVQLAAIRALSYCQFQASGDQLNIIKKKLQEIVENILWSMVAISDIEAEKNTLKLNQALELEKESNFELMFNLLSFIYKPATTDLIKKNIIGENIIFALEIIDNFMSQDVKLLIIPLLDKLTVNQRIKRLNPYFELSKMTFVDRLKEIIIRDHDRVNSWTKAKAIELLGKIHKKLKKITSETLLAANESATKKTSNSTSKSTLPIEIIKSMSYEDELVYSTAAKVVYENNPELCLKTLKESASAKDDLIEILSNPKTEKILIQDRVKLLKRIFIFFDIPENILVKLAKLLKSEFVKKGDSLSFYSTDNQENVILLLKGIVVFGQGTEEELQFSRNDIIIRGINIPEEADSVVVKKNCHALLLNRVDYFNLLVEESEIIAHIYDRLESKK